MAEGASRHPDHAFGRRRAAGRHLSARWRPPRWSRRSLSHSAGGGGHGSGVVRTLYPVVAQRSLRERTCRSGVPSNVPSTQWYSVGSAGLSAEQRPCDQGLCGQSDSSEDLSCALSRWRHGFESLPACHVMSRDIGNTLNPYLGRVPGLGSGRSAEGLVVLGGVDGDLCG